MPQVELNLDLFNNFCETVLKSLFTYYDRPVKTDFANFPISLKAILKPTSGNLLSLLGAQNKNLSTALQRLLIKVKLHLPLTLTRKELLKKFYD